MRTIEEIFDQYIKPQMKLERYYEYMNWLNDIQYKKEQKKILNEKYNDRTKN